jgi:two-component system, chemotaxis family, CheB/CheR fusion protein
MAENPSDPKQSKSQKKSDGGKENDFLVVGLGASAGGIQALKQFFSRVPKDSGIAYVVILHMSPEHESKLAEILQAASSIPVTQVRDQTEVKPDNVYVIPPNQNLSMSDGHLSLTDMISVHERRSPVDLFFRTLAETNEARSVSVILSGTGANGSMGLKRVKEHGGVTFVQEPDEAEYDDMPRNAISTGLVDYVLPVGEIPAKIFSYNQQRGKIQIASAADIAVTDEQAFTEIFTQLRIRTGHDFSNYKRGTMLRRIERRIGIAELKNLPEYARYLRNNRNEAEALLKDLLISVTNFFRDPESVEALGKQILPSIFDRKDEKDQVRVWVAGCATGEEAYSIAMLLMEAASESRNHPLIQVFASDLDTDAVAFAREGLYKDAEVADVSPERLRRFFTKERNGYRIRREIREIVLFTVHNLTKDPPFSHLDLVSCRNLLIYLNGIAQTKVLEILHFALNPSGYLFLGASESIEGSMDLFSSVDKEHHIFQSKPVPVRPPFLSPETIFTLPRLPLVDKEATPQQRRAIERLSYLDLHQRLLEQFAPPSVIVDEQSEIVHLSDRAGRFMQLTGGEPSNNLLTIVRPELKLELRTALYEAMLNRTQVDVPELQVKTDDGIKTVKISVRPVLREEDPGRGFVLVLFDELGPEVSTPLRESVRQTTPVTQQLEEALTRAKEQLRSTVEQYEIQQEELRASNEELQAMNEELRSSTEELETSKEELQSVNEELTTVNQELKIKIEELSQSNNDFVNLMNSTDIGTIFLDRSLRVKMFTPRARDSFKLIQSDVGRPLPDISSRLLYDDLFTDVDQVLASLHKLEREVESIDHRWYTLRILPYRTTQDHIEGVVINLIDITDSTITRSDLLEARNDLESKVEERTLDLQKLTQSLRGEVAERKQAEEARTKLLGQIVSAQENERRRLARDLHDHLGQQLTALRLKLETVKSEVGKRSKAQSEIDELLKIANQIDSDIDFLAWELRPVALDDLGLAEAQRVYVNQWSEHFNISAEFHSVGLEIRPSREIENQLYRISQEALNNVAKHARASRVDIILERQENHVILIVEDNGVGFSVTEAPTEETLGISGMRERAALLGGDLEIESDANKGTTLFVKIPLSFEAKVGAGGNGQWIRSGF